LLHAGDEDATLDMTAFINAGWQSSAKVAWASLTGEPRWGWTRLNFALTTEGTLELTTHDTASKVALVTEDGVLITVGSCPAPLTVSGASSQLTTGTTTTGATAMASCDYSRLRVKFQPGTYKLAVRYGVWPNPTGTWTGGYFQAQITKPCEQLPGRPACSACS
jgi:hypothetical protein